MTTTPISDRIAAQVADILAQRGQALMQVRRPSLDVEAVNRRLAPDYRVEDRHSSLCLIHVGWGINVANITPDMTSATIALVADVHRRGALLGERQEWDRHRNAAKAAGLKGPLVMPPGYTPPKSRTRRTPEAEAPAAGPSL